MPRSASCHVLHSLSGGQASPCGRPQAYLYPLGWKTHSGYRDDSDQALEAPSLGKRSGHRSAHSNWCVGRRDIRCTGVGWGCLGSRCWLVDTDPSPSLWPAVTVASLRTPNTRPKASSGRIHWHWTTGRHPAHPPHPGRGTPAVRVRGQAPRGPVPTPPLCSPWRGGTAPADNRLSRQGGMTAGGGGVAPGRRRRWWHNG